MIYIVKHLLHADKKLTCEQRGNKKQQKEKKMANSGIELETSSSKQHNLEADSIPVSTVALAPSCKFQCAFGKIVQSVKIVIFSAKINVLLPFGPASIILHYLTNHHVSVMSVVLNKTSVPGPRLHTWYQFNEILSKS